MPVYSFLLAGCFTAYLFLSSDSWSVSLEQCCSRPMWNEYVPLVAAQPGNLVEFAV